MAIREAVVRSVPSGLVHRTLKGLHRLPGWYAGTTNVYEREWDVLVLLDACRWDTYRTATGRSSHIHSVGSTSGEWMDNTFVEEYSDEIARTAYVCGNPHSDRLEEADFGLLDHVWSYAWDADLGTIRPGPITDRGITVSRTGKYDRVILHYMQPHYPFIADSASLGRVGDPNDAADEEGTVDVWEQVMAGEVDPDVAVAAYEANLELVLDSIDHLFENIDGTVAVTADHGNALGRWGYWGHRGYLPFPSLRRVPWDVRDCVDEETYEPPGYDTDAVSGEVDDRLRDLGYR